MSSACHFHQAHCKSAEGKEKKNRQPNEEMVAMIGDQLDIKIIT